VKDAAAGKVTVKAVAPLFISVTWSVTISAPLTVTVLTSVANPPFISSLTCGLLVPIPVFPVVALNYHIG